MSRPVTALTTLSTCRGTVDQPVAGLGGAGTPVTVSGGGFPANLPVGVYLGVFGDQIGRGSAQRYASGVTDDNGNYRMTLTMLATWPDGSPVAQDRLVVMVASDDFSVQVSDVFNYLLPGPVQPTLTPTPTSTPPVRPTATPQSSIVLAPDLRTRRHGGDCGGCRLPWQYAGCALSGDL